MLKTLKRKRKNIISTFLESFYHRRVLWAGWTSVISVPLGVGWLRLLSQPTIPEAQTDVIDQSKSKYMVCV